MKVVSAPESTAFRTVSKPLELWRTKLICLPSADQWGQVLAPAFVNRIKPPRVKSRRWISRVASEISKAPRFPSGESEGFRYAWAGASIGVVEPFRSAHANLPIHAGPPA